LHRSAFTTIRFGYYDIPINLKTAKDDIMKALGPELTSAILLVDIPARSERGKITNANHAKIIFATKKKAREAIHKTRNSRIKFMN